ncbi:MAG: hypothetical protein Q8O92_10765 [Candidatus Latescibacter sp.]|nr:hypothetical protein [Candidatus Latescibacter sp.]
MQTIKTYYEDLPETISIPREFIHKKAKIIIIMEEDSLKNTKRLVDIFGILPDFPDRFPQGDYGGRIL